MAGKQNRKNRNRIQRHAKQSRQHPNERPKKHGRIIGGGKHHAAASRVLRWPMRILSQSRVLSCMENIRPEVFFLIAAILFGGIFVFLIPPFQVPDEIAHFHRAYAISEGHVIMERRDGVTGALMPTSLQAITSVSENLPFHPEARQDRTRLRTMMAMPLDPTERTFIVVTGAANYAPIPYLPHLIGIWIGRLIGMPVLGVFWTARIFGLLGYCGIMALAIRLMPWGKRTLSLLALLPMALTEAVGISADSMTMGLTFLFCALVFRAFADSAFVKEHTGIPLSTWVAFLLLSAALPLCKSLYILVLGLLLLLPFSGSSNGTPRQVRNLRLIGVGVCWLTAIAVFAIWNRMTSGLSALSQIDGVNAASQISGMIADPVAGAKVIFGSMWSQGKAHLLEMIGVLGWLDTRLPMWMYLAYMVMLASLFLLDGPSCGWMARCWSGLLFLGISIAVFASLYMAWTRIGAPAVEGVQGRYFLPLMPLVAAAIGFRPSESRRRYAAWLSGLVPFLLLLTLGVVYLRYWGP